MIAWEKYLPSTDGRTPFRVHHLSLSMIDPYRSLSMEMSHQKIYFAQVKFGNGFRQFTIRLGVKVGVDVWWTCFILAGYGCQYSQLLDGQQSFKHDVTCCQ